MRDRLRPSLDDLRLDYRIFEEAWGLEPEAFYAFMRILSVDATSRVWTYDPPDPEGGVPDYLFEDPRLFGSKSRKRLKKSLDQLKRFGLIVHRDGKTFPVRRVIYVASSIGDSRPSIPASIRSEVMRRDNFTCVYCGSKQGPFDIDHVVPYSRGGSHIDPENLVCACGSCNREKSALTPEEWISRAPSQRLDP